MHTIIADICNLRPNTITTRTKKTVQKRIDARLSAVDLGALSESDRWSIAIACQFARSEVGQGAAAAQAITVLARTRV